MESSAFYQQENAHDFFSQLADATECIRCGDYDLLYRCMARLFNRILNGATANLTLLLSGAYAKTDYLLKKHGADKKLSLMVNDARIRFGKLSRLDLQEMRRWVFADIEAVARFTGMVFGCPVPAELRRMFPADRPKRNTGRLTHEYLRIVVNGFTDNLISGSTPSDPGQELLIGYTGDTDKGVPDFSYLRPLLHDGVQLNLIRPRRSHDGILYPELIVYEPDLLTDISAVAGCFETYTTSATVHLLKRLMPPPSGDAINLGNFAGQLLDEIIHNDDSSYAESALRFFRQHALALSAEPPAPQFHSDAKKQIEHIHHAVDVQMPGEVSSFDRTRLMVEPTFFSEMLGLQGRMDFLQLDLKILAEQKSGNGEWPQGNYDVPRMRLPHYVQLLLYMAIIRYNFARQYRDNNEELHAFLMYSRYKQSLLRLGFAPGLLLQAMEIRNRIVADELKFSREGFGFLVTTTAESLNTSGRDTALWKRFTLPKLHQILDPIHNASDTERAYFLRFMRFIAREHILSKTGNRQKEGHGFASTWHDSLEDKLDAGNIYPGMRMSYDFPDKEKIETLELFFPDSTACDMANFRKGDIVILYPYDEGEIPDVRRNMVFRCTIEEIGADNIILRLRAAQSGPAPFEINRNRLWAIEHDFIESSYSSLYRGMHAFLTATQARRDLILFKRRPQVRSRKLIGDYGRFNSLASRVAAACDLFLIIGPPGTGKTSYGMLTTVQEELHHPESNIIIMAYTNRAVDEICTKLIENSIEFIRIGSDMSCAPPSRPYLLSSKVRNISKASELADEINRHRVFVATTTALNANPALFRLKQFSLGVIDEASQILEPQLLGILSARTESGADAISRFVLIGDHKQLPAIVQQTPGESAVDEECLHEIGLLDCRLSLFERLAVRYSSDPSVCHMLTTQGRMHRSIAAFASRNFYSGKLREVPLPHQTAALADSPADATVLRRLIDSHRMLFFDVHDSDTGLADKVNHSEARLIGAIIQEIYRKEGSEFDAADTVGVIVPYRNQIAAIRSEIAACGIAVLNNICIDTVERYQGSQRKYIIYGFTVRKYYQLQFLTSHVFEDTDGMIIDRKLNVALTRAREYMIMTGDSVLLRRNAVFSRLISHIESCGGFVTDMPPASENS